MFPLFIDWSHVLGFLGLHRRSIKGNRTMPETRFTERVSGIYSLTPGLGFFSLHQRPTIDLFLPIIEKSSFFFNKNA